MTRGFGTKPTAVVCTGGLSVATTDGAEMGVGGGAGTPGGRDAVAVADGVGVGVGDGVGVGVSVPDGVGDGVTATRVAIPSVHLFSFAGS